MGRRQTRNHGLFPPVQMHQMRRHRLDISPRLRSEGCSPGEQKGRIGKPGLFVTLSTAVRAVFSVPAAGRMCLSLGLDVCIEIITDAVKTYANSRGKDLNRLSEYAEQFHITKALKTYLEVLL